MGTEKEQRLFGDSYELLQIKRRQAGYTYGMEDLKDSAEKAVELMQEDDPDTTITNLDALASVADTTTEIKERAKDYFKHPVSDAPLEKTQKLYNDWVDACVDIGRELPNTLSTACNPFLLEFSLEVWGFNNEQAIEFFNDRYLFGKENIDIESIFFPDNDPEKAKNIISKWWRAFSLDGVGPVAILERLVDFKGEYINYLPSSVLVEVLNLVSGQIDRRDAQEWLSGRDMELFEQIEAIKKEIATDDLLDDNQARIARMNHLTYLIGQRNLLEEIFKKV